MFLDNNAYSYEIIIIDYLCTMTSLTTTIELFLKTNHAYLSAEAMCLKIWDTIGISLTVITLAIHSTMRCQCILDEGTCSEQY